jgi:hypothetical protein
VVVASGATGIAAQDLSDVRMMREVLMIGAISL